METHGISLYLALENQCVPLSGGPLKAQLLPDQPAGGGRDGADGCGQHFRFPERGLQWLCLFGGATTTPGPSLMAPSQGYHNIVPLSPSLPALRVILSFKAQLKNSIPHAGHPAFFFLSSPTPRVSKDPQGILICSTAPSWWLPGPRPLAPPPSHRLPFLTSLSSWTYVEPGSPFLSWGSTA